MRCRWLAFLALVFEETKLNENPLSWNWTRQTKFLDRSDLALRGDAVSGFMPREAGASFTSGATGHEQNVSPPGKVGPREALLGGWGNNKKICLASSLWIKIKTICVTSLPLLLNSSRPPPVSCNLPKALHGCFSVCSYRCVIATGSTRTPTIMIRDIASTPLTSSQLSEPLCSL